MAWLEFTGGAFRISYRFGGRKHHHALKTADRREALSTLGRFDSNVRLIEQGAIEPPPPGDAELESEGDSEPGSEASLGPGPGPGLP